MQQQTEQKLLSDRRPYEPPAIIYEAALEVRAGSPLSITDPVQSLLDPTNPLDVK